jgi:NADP-dependent 3-hydroxy acid dehydrogenase YdfG
MQGLNGVTAFVTGGASGIGLSIAQALKAHGARVAIADIEGDRLAEVARAEGFFPIELDVSDRAAAGEALAKTEAELGPLRILVNNAGVGILGLIEEASFPDWDWALSVNLMGVINGLVPGLARIKAHGLGGHIVNTASMAALRVAAAAARALCHHQGGDRRAIGAYAARAGRYQHWRVGAVPRRSEDQYRRERPQPARAFARR